MDTLPYWKDDACNAVANRTDGTLFPPPIKESKVMQVFYPEFCRSRNYKFEMYVISHDLKGMRFRIPPSFMESPAKNPENWCFCPYEEISRCGWDGIEYLTPCHEGAYFSHTRINSDLSCSICNNLLLPTLSHDFSIFLYNCTI